MSDQTTSDQTTPDQAMPDETTPDETTPEETTASEDTTSIEGETSIEGDGLSTLETDADDEFDEFDELDEPVIETMPMRDWMSAAPVDWAGFVTLSREINETKASRNSFRDWVAKHVPEDDILRRGIGLYACGLAREAAELLTTQGDDLSRLLLGKSLIEIGDLDGAIEALDPLTASSQVGLQAQLALMEIAARRFDADLAQAGFANLEKLGASKADMSYAEGLAAEAQGEHEAAVSAWRAALAEEPLHPGTLFQLAFRLDLDGEDDEAYELYAHFANGDVTPHAGAILNLGMMAEDRNDFETAQKCYRWVATANPLNNCARRYLADAEAADDQFYDESRERKADKQNAVLRIPVTDFELSVRARNCLQRMNIHTLGDLVQRTESELLSFKNFGETSLQEVKDILVMKGLRLGMMPNQDRPASKAASADSGDEVLSRPVSELDLSVRSRTALGTLGIASIGDLARTSPATLLACKNFGQTSLDEIKRKLAEFGLDLTS